MTSSPAQGVTPKYRWSSRSDSFLAWRVCYPLQDVNRELWAQAIRAYMIDPNYMKTVAPNAAAVIRGAVNAYPELSKIIQFDAEGIPIPISLDDDEPTVAANPN